LTDRAIVGQIVSARGVKGEVRVYPLVDDPDFFSQVKSVWLGRGDDPGEPRRIIRARFLNNYAVLQLEGVATRNEAEALAGMKLSVPVSEMPPLEEGLYYHFQLEGLRVETTEGHFLGILDHVMETGSNDVYVVRDPAGKDLLIPATHEVIQSINLEARSMVVTPLDGMFEDA